MSLWLKARRWRTAVASLAIFVAVVGLSGDTSVPLPAFTNSGGLGIPLVLLSPMIVVVGAAIGITSGESALDSVACRPIALLDSCYATVAAIIGTGACVCLWVFAESELALSAGRNLFGLSGLYLAGRAVLGSQGASAVPAFYFVAATVFGRRQGQEVFGWAWVVSRDAPSLTWVWAGSALLIGLALSLRGRRRLYSGLSG